MKRLLIFGLLALGFGLAIVDDSEARCKRGGGKIRGLIARILHR